MAQKSESDKLVLKSNESSELVPMRLLMHKDLLEDKDIIKVDGNWYIIDFTIPSNSSNTIILSSTDIEPSMEEFDRAYDLCMEFIVTKAREKIELEEVDREYFNEERFNYQSDKDLNDTNDN